MPRIALDAMGGDHAPGEIVAGALDSELDVVLVGDRAVLEPLAGGLPIVHAAEVIDMGDDPARALREKRGSSIAVAAKLVADGEADGLVAAGSTGATMAAAALIIGRMNGVLRPAIATVVPAGEKGKIVLDVGANPNVKVENLVQFAVMGAALAETRLGIATPTVGLLNIGEEPGKGRDLEREAYDALEKAPINFIGNVEGHDVVGERPDVIVADGFTGNVALKTSEGTSRFVMDAIKRELGAVLIEHPELAGILAPRLERLRARLHPESYGGASLLGVKGVVTIAHGSSSRTAIANAIRMTAQEAERHLLDRIRAGLES
ncbi:MAG: phosphate acyltransferase PlsX [Acidimicrobiia bacterium]|nr:phosphate acyltransferase PlsX [Acidimicrobiia bacterium]NNF09988.1 phosphate acyltransferase PlsX [Acidimicrobiia bacterium]NNL70686.1 phosphate acyltransferase PlsX [Acidimicrobiia bacterium]